MILRSFLCLFLLFSVFSCRETNEKNTAFKPGKEDLVRLNRYLVRKDRERIINYIERKDLDMLETQTGLWYQVLKNGNGKTFTDSDTVVMNYECSLLDGTLCYTSKVLGPKNIILGKKDSIEPGLNEALRLINKCTEAIFIMPSYLAYGIVGDGKKIPPKSVIVYRISVLCED